MRAALVGGAVGILAWFSPDLVGGGDAITQRVLRGDVLLAAIPGAFLIRFALSTVWGA
jgi:CIC family chloride channel protein